MAGLEFAQSSCFCPWSSGTTGMHCHHIWPYYWKGQWNLSAFICQLRMSTLFFSRLLAICISSFTDKVVLLFGHFYLLYICLSVCVVSMCTPMCHGIRMEVREPPVGVGSHSTLWTPLTQLRVPGLRGSSPFTLWAILAAQALVLKPHSPVMDNW